MPRRETHPLPVAVAVRLEVVDEPGAIAAIAAAVGVAGGRVRTLSTVRRSGRAGVVPEAPTSVEVELEVESADEHDLVAALSRCARSSPSA